MNLVIVFDGLQVGGIERVGVDYINLLVKRGHNVSIINVTPSLKDMYPQLPKECRVYEMNIPRYMVPYRYAKGVEKGISGALLYAFIALGLAFFFELRKLLSLKIRKLISEADVVIAFSGHFNDLMLVASSGVKKKVAWLHGSEFEYKVISDGYFALYNKIKNLVCLSELCDVTCKKFNESNGIKKELIYNPIAINARNLDKEKIQSLKDKYGKFVLMAGRLAQDKDQKTAILAVKYLNEKRHEKIHLLLAGDGINREMLEQFVKEQKVDEYVHFLGNCFDMQNYYSAAHVYVHSSPMEGLPTVLLEAMAYGVPIASTDSIPGVREILGNNECGLISPVYDWKSLGNNIERLYDDENLRNEFRDKGKKRIKNFAPEVAIDKFEKFISKI